MAQAGFFFCQIIIFLYVFPIAALTVPALPVLKVEMGQCLFSFPAPHTGTFRGVPQPETLQSVRFECVRYSGLSHQQFAPCLV